MKIAIDALLPWHPLEIQYINSAQSSHPLCFFTNDPTADLKHVWLFSPFLHFEPGERSRQDTSDSISFVIKSSPFRTIGFLTFPDNGVSGLKSGPISSRSRINQPIGTLNLRKNKIKDKRKWGGLKQDTSRSCVHLC